MIAARTPATGTATEETALTTAPLLPADAAAFAAPADAWLAAVCWALAAAPCPKAPTLACLAAPLKGPFVFEAAEAFLEAECRAMTERAPRTVPLACSMPESSSESSASDTATSAIARLRFPLAWAARRDFAFGLPAPAGEGSPKSALPRLMYSSWRESASPVRSADPFTIPAEKTSGRSSAPRARICSQLAASRRADPSEYVAALSGIAALPGSRECLGALYLGDLLGLGVEQVVERALREVVLERNAHASRHQKALAGLDGVVDVAFLLGREGQQVDPALAIEVALLVQEHEIRVQHHVAGVLVLEHVGRVLRDARADEVELAALRPELGEVADDRRVPEEALHLVDVKPGGHAALEVRVHSVAHRFQRREHAEDPHVLREVLEVDVGDAVGETHVALVVEERKRPLHVALVSERDVARLGLLLIEQQLVEVAEHGQSPLVLAAHVGKLHAAADDRLVRLGQSLAPLGHGRAGKRQYRVDLEGELRLVGLVGDVGEVEGVHERVGVRGEAYAGPARGLHNRRILACRIEDDHLVVGIREKRVHDLALDAEALSRARLAADEPHGARELLAVADDEVARLLGLAVVAAAFLVELLGGEGHLYGHLGGRHVARYLHVVESQRQDGVHALALAVRKRLHLDGALARRRHDLTGLVVEGLWRVRVGEHQPRVGEQALVLVLELVEELFGLLLGVRELGRQDGEVVALLHRAHLLVDDLLVHPGDALLHVGHRGCLAHGVDVERDVERHRQIDDVCDAVVLQVATEAAKHQHAAPGFVSPVAVGAPVRLEVEHRGRDEVLGA